MLKFFQQEPNAFCCYNSHYGELHSVLILLIIHLDLENTFFLEHILIYEGISDFIFFIDSGSSFTNF